MEVRFQGARADPTVDSEKRLVVDDHECTATYGRVRCVAKDTICMNERL